MLVRPLQRSCRGYVGSNHRLFDACIYHGFLVPVAGECTVILVADTQSMKLPPILRRTNSPPHARCRVTPRLVVTAELEPGAGAKTGCLPIYAPPLSLLMNTLALMEKHILGSTTSTESAVPSTGFTRMRASRI